MAQLGERVIVDSGNVSWGRAGRGFNSVDLGYVDSRYMPDFYS